MFQLIQNFVLHAILKCDGLVVPGINFLFSRQVILVTLGMVMSLVMMVQDSRVNILDAERARFLALVGGVNFVDGVHVRHDVDGKGHDTTNECQ